MYKTVLKNGKTVWYFVNELPGIRDEEADYISVIVPSADELAAQTLYERGYCFAGRSVLLDIPLRQLKAPVKMGDKFAFSVTGEWDPEEIYDIAKESFDEDERFAVDLARNDREMKNELLRGFIAELRQRGLKATLLYCGEKLGGFNLWEASPESGRIWLGAVSAACRNTGLAVPLYHRTAEAMKNEGTNALRDFVGTTNTAALNLHAMLIQCAGGRFRFGTCRDAYKKERGRN